MPAEKGSMHWEKSPADLTERFAAVTDRHPDIARRKMFGEIAGFVNGNMVTGLHSGRWFVRLTGDAKAEALALPGAGPFEPMPGRPMGDYVVLPPAGRRPTTRRWTAGWSGGSRSAGRSSRSRRPLLHPPRGPVRRQQVEERHGIEGLRPEHAGPLPRARRPGAPARRPG